jgi:hypothetical protein
MYMMGEAIRRIVWSVIVVCTCAYAVYLIAGDLINARVHMRRQTIEIDDAIASGVHTLSGAVYVPEDCNNIFVRTSKVSTSTYRIFFETWRNSSSECAATQTKRTFHAVVLTPSKEIDFTALFDGAPVPIHVISHPQATLP